MRSSSTSGESFTGIYKVLQVFTTEKGNGKSSKKLKKHNSVGCNSGDIAATIDDMREVRNELQHMPEIGKVILFALFQLELASLDHSGRYSNCLRRELAVLFARVR